MTLQVEDSLVGVVLYTQLISMYPGDPNVFAYTATTADITAYGYPQKVAGHGSGAGLTSLSGRQAAVGEAVERYAASVVHPEDLLYGAYDDLVAAGENPIHPSRWALYDPSQYSSVPFPQFTRGTPIVWTRVENVSRQELSLAPASSHIHAVCSHPWRNGGGCGHRNLDRPRLWSHASPRMGRRPGGARRA